MLNRILVLLAVILSFQALAHGNQTDDHGAKLSGSKTEPGKVVLMFHKALKEQDGETAKSFLVDDIVIFESGGIDRSAEEYASDHMLLDMNYLSSIYSELIEHSVQHLSGTATSLTVSIYTDKSGKTYRSLETAVLRQIDGQWKISHIHWSTKKLKKTASR